MVTPMRLQSWAGASHTGSFRPAENLRFYLKCNRKPLVLGEEGGGERFKQISDMVSVVIAFKTSLYMLCVK